MTVAEQAREAVRSEPFLHDALRAGLVNYSAAARYLDVDGETDAVVAALRRFADELPDYEAPSGTVPVSMQSGVGEGDPADALLAVGETAIVPDGGSQTAVLATGGVGASDLRRVLGRLSTADVPVDAAAAAAGSIVIVVGRRHGANAVRAVEDAFEE